MTDDVPLAWVVGTLSSFGVHSIELSSWLGTLRSYVPPMRSYTIRYFINDLAGHALASACQDFLREHGLAFDSEDARTEWATAHHWPKFRNDNEGNRTASAPVHDAASFDSAEVPNLLEAEGFPPDLSRYARLGHLVVCWDEVRLELRYPMVLDHRHANALRALVPETPLHIRMGETSLDFIFRALLRHADEVGWRNIQCVRDCLNDLGQWCVDSYSLKP